MTVFNPCTYPTVADPVSLLCHPARPCRAASQIAVSASRREDGGLSVRYRVAAAGNSILLPAPTGETDQLTDGLWQHTCCEAFVGRTTNRAYREFNFSPSGAWAAYAFLSYRQRDESSAARLLGRPDIHFCARPETFELCAELPASLLPDGRGGLEIGLAVVIESQFGSTSAHSYWALSHPGPQPDFHHRASFMLRLD